MATALTLALGTIAPALIVRTLVIFVILGVCYYLVETYVPMPAPFKVVMRVVVVLLLVLWLLSTFGLI